MCSVRVLCSSYVLGLGSSLAGAVAHQHGAGCDQGCAQGCAAGCVPTAAISRYHSYHSYSSQPIGAALFMLVAAPAVGGVACDWIAPCSLPTVFTSQSSRTLLLIMTDHCCGHRLITRHRYGELLQDLDALGHTNATAMAMSARMGAQTARDVGYEAVSEGR